MYVMGIDPGLKGGLALLDAQAAEVRPGHRLRMPVVKVGNKKHVDVGALREWSEGLPEVKHVVIEQVSAMPQQGVTSSFTFGAAYGAINAAARLLWPTAGITHTTPAVWKKAMQLSSSKTASLDACLMRFGEDPAWRVGANDGIAEAALLALWWVEQRRA